MGKNSLCESLPFSRNFRLIFVMGRLFVQIPLPSFGRKEVDRWVVVIS